MLRVKNLVKIYESDEYKVEALKNISLCFRNNEFVSILGPSGCGKTTFLNIIGGLDRYTSGNVTISGISTKHFSDKHWDAYRNNSVGFVFQSYNLIPHLSILDNVALTLSLAGVTKAQRIKRSKEVLDKVGLSNQYNKLPSQLSGGQMQRVAIARALINEPDVILADEPTGALDAKLSIQVMEILKEISKTTLVIMVTHNETLAETYSTRIIKMLDGEITDDSNPFNEVDAIKADIDEINELDILPEEKNQLLKLQLKDLNEIENSNNKLQNEKEDSDIYNENQNIIEDLKNKINNMISDNKKLAEEKLKSKPKFIQKLHRKKKDKAAVVVPFKGTSMKYKTAITLSLKNLNSKKRRTILTTFAGSIGIISLALVMALSWGYQQYIEKMQKNVLASVPVSVYEYTMKYEDFTKMFSGIEGNEERPSEYSGTIYLDDNSSSNADIGEILTKLLGSFGLNNLSEEYLDYVLKLDPNLYDSITVLHGNQFNLITKTKDDLGNLTYVDVSKTPNATGALNIGTTVLGEQGLQTNNWHQLVGSKKYIEDYYNVIEGKYPESMNEIVLVIDNKNTIDISALEDFGFDVYERDDDGNILYEPKIDKENNILLDEDGNPIDDLDKPKKIKTIKIDGDISKTFESLGTFKLINNNDYYFKYEDYYVSPANYDDKLEESYNKSSLELKVVGILKPNPNNPTMGSIVGNHLCYTPELAEYVYETSIKSEVAKAQIDAIKNDNTAILPGTKPIDPESSKSKYRVAKFTSVVRDKINGEIKTFEDGNNALLIDGGLKATAELQRIGAIKNPKFISIFATNFNTKNEVISYLEKYNEDKLPRDQIEHFDMSEMFIQNIRTVMSLMTIVLLALASISLIVSSIMIGIITGNSVYERTREIGMMRALGARKQDIARVFNTETGLIGLFSGLLGIVIPYILIPFINIGLKARFYVSNILVLNPLHAFILLILSMVLTFIAGIIPSQMAAKRDIVRSIRTE